MQKKLLIFLAILLISVGQTANQLLLGSTQSFDKTTFCKKYKCKALDPNHFGENAFMLTLSSDNINWFNDDLASGKFNLNQVIAKYRTLVQLFRDSKKQITTIHVELSEELRANDSINNAGNEALTELIATATGKKYKLKESKFGPWSMFIDSCFIDARSPEVRNKARAFVADTGYVTLEVSKKRVKYNVECAAYANGVGKGTYTPQMEITIP